MIHILLTRLIRQIRSSRPWGIGAITLVLLIAVLGNAICFYAFERQAYPELDFEDALWYSIISITTIGYGDFSATTTPARLATVLFVVIVGLSTFSLLFGTIIDWFTDIALRGDRGMSTVHARNHTLIVHFPSEARVRQLIAELRSETRNDIIIVSDQIESLPFQEPNVHFVRGSSVSEATYARASIAQAAKAIVLATSYSDYSSDAVVAAAASVIDHLKPEIHLVAECLDDQHRMLFNSVNTDAIVSVMRITGNLLVQESQDPGVSQLFNIITSNLEGDTLFSTRVQSPADASYSVLCKSLIEQDINLLAVIRGPQTFTTFRNIQPAVGDNLVYLGSRRLTWPEFLEHLS